MNRWFGASLAFVATTIGLFVWAPPWLVAACSEPAEFASTSCTGSVSPFFIGFIGSLGAVTCALWGFVRRRY